MTTLQSYRVYLALRLHFTDDKYDIRKTKGRINVTEAMLAKKQKIVLQLQKLQRKYPKKAFMDYFVANLSGGDKWGGLYDIIEGHQRYLKWQKRQESLSYTFKNEIGILAEQATTVENLWDCSNGHPIILREYLGGTISLETVAILNKLFIFHDVINTQLAGDPVWASVRSLLDKYSPFIQIDKEKYRIMTEQAFA